MGSSRNETKSLTFSRQEHNARGARSEIEISAVTQLYNQKNIVIRRIIAEGPLQLKYVPYNPTVTLWRPP